MAKKQLEFLIYTHKDREFSYYTGNRSKFEEIMASGIQNIPQALTEEDIDGLLILNKDLGRWFLGFSEEMGIVAQRTARRQADSIVRSGFRYPDGGWMKEDYPLEELSDPNIGDLWKTVQQKYVKDTSLTGMTLDEETGIPSQLKERAERLEKVGQHDALTEAKLEKEEAKNRKKAMKRSKTTTLSQAISKPKKEPKPKEETKPKKEAPKPVETEEEEEPDKSDELASKSTERKEGFFEISNVIHNVIDGATQVVCKGQLSGGRGRPKKLSILFDQKHLTKKEWANIVLFLEKGDIAKLTIDEEDGVVIATTIEV